MEVSKADWKLFRERIPEWQERHMARLNREYVALLNGEGAASEKFWALEKRVSADKRSPGVLISLKRSEMIWDIRELLDEGVISTKDLDGFSEELKEVITSYQGITFAKFDFSEE